MPRVVRGAQLLLFALGFTGLLVMLAGSDGSTSYGLGVLMAPWILVWVCALLALTYDGSARHGVRPATCLVLGFVMVGSVSQAGRADVPGDFFDAVLRILLGLPATVLLCLPEATAWFRRPGPGGGVR
jgi:hypothetical protein